MNATRIKRQKNYSMKMYGEHCSKQARNDYLLTQVKGRENFIEGQTNEALFVRDFHKEKLKFNTI